MKFKDGAIKPGMVIHCPWEENARALLEHLGKLGYVWTNSEEKPIESSNYSTYKEDTCYNIMTDGKHISYGSLQWKRTDEVTEFIDLLEPETLSGKEVIKWFNKYSREIESMSETFPNCKTIADVVENYTPECIMEKMVWYEKHKLKPCPFCGSKDIHITDAWPHYAYCPGCGAAARKPPYDIGLDGIMQAAERWNRRAEYA